MVGRTKELKELQSRYESAESEFVTVYGRRRVGKTFLIRNAFVGRFAFQHAGLARGGMKKQLRHFKNSLKEAGRIVEKPMEDWVDAFVYPVGVQIDLHLDRADNVINVCEMKYFAGLYAIDKAADADFEQKLETFRAVTKTEKAVHLTLVTSRGLVRNAYANSVQSEVTLDDLFRA